MKGMVLVELVRMAELSLGEDAIDEVLASCPLSTSGAFTRVGNYPCSDLINIVEELSLRSATPADELQRAFGHWMMAHFVETYPEFFIGKADSFAMLEAIDAEVHVEVRKLYPDAELPRFRTERLDDSRLRMTYSSPRPLGAFCKGLIEACLEYFGEAGRVTEVEAPVADRPILFDVVLTP